MISFQTYVGSAFSSNPIRWIETPEAARSRYALDKIPENAADPDQGKPHSVSGDVLDISPDTQKALAQSQSDSRISLKDGGADTGKTSESAPKSTEKLPTGTELTAEEQKEVDELKARDQEVRMHEMAHVLAGGAFVTSGPSYTYQTGPDGKGYAVGGSVGIDTSPVEGNPEATIQKMQTVAAAALAPAKPSGPDLKVAAAARQTEAKARSELSQLQAGQQESKEQPDSESVFSIVRPADRVANASSNPSAKSDAADGVMSSQMRVKSGVSSELSPSSAYRAQSTMTLASPRFTAFA